jgi:MFS transporter, ACS family, D-galactonate transporter
MPEQVIMNDSRMQVRHPWALLILLAFAMFLNFFLRVNLSVAAPILGPEMKLSPQSLGLLLSSFYWTYALCQIWTGWLVDRGDVKWIYTAALSLWSMAAFFIGFTHSFTVMLCMLLLLGLGESVAYPATSRILISAFPENRRGLANSAIDMGGARLGPALGTLFGGLMVAGMGWRWLFLLTGAAVLIWLIPWLFLAPRRSNQVEHVVTAEIGWADLLRRRAVWATCFGQGGANYAWYFLLSWLPSYLVKERHFSLSAMAVWAALPYFLMAATSIGGGIFADRLISRGASAIRIRKRFVCSGLIITAFLLPLVLIPRIEWALAGLLAACFTYGIYASNLWALSQTLAGPKAAGRWTGFQNACANLAGVIAPLLTGFIVARTGQFALAFVGASLACLFGAASYWFFVDLTDANLGAEQLTTATAIDG